MKGKFKVLLTKCNQFVRFMEKYSIIIVILLALSRFLVVSGDIEPQPSYDDDDVTQKHNPLLKAPQNVAAMAAHQSSTDETNQNGKPSAGTSSNVFANLGFLHGFIASLSVIVVSELGDKTFFIAAIMAMRHSRTIVFTGAITALGLMTILSAVFGMAATIIPRVYTYYISTVLFALFGLKMLRDGYYMNPADAQEELEEVKSEFKKLDDERIKLSSTHENEQIEQMLSDNVPETIDSMAETIGNDDVHKTGSTIRTIGKHSASSSSLLKLQFATLAAVHLKSSSDHDIYYKNQQYFQRTHDGNNQKNRHNHTTCHCHSFNHTAIELEPLRQSSSRYEMTTVIQDPESGIIRKKSLKSSSGFLRSRVLMQAFTMTFLAEWGDRSQLTTIILAAREDIYGVVVGGILGHSLCTGLAVIGGRMIAERISVRTVTLVGGVVFLLFALSALFISPNEDVPANLNP